MFLNIFLFEIRYWLRQPMVYIFLLINALLIFGATASDNVTVGESVGNVHKNAPYVVENFYALMSIISLLMVTAFLNVAAARDFNFNTNQIIFSTPLRKFDFLIGRFAGASIIAMIPFLGVSIGNIVGAAMPWLDAERIGPTMLSAHVNGFTVFIIPNVLFGGAIIFAIAAITRSTIYSFIGSIILLVGYGISQGLVRDLKSEFIGTLLDPFGVRTFSVATKYWTVEDKNTMSMGLTGILLINRLIWMGVALAILVFAYVKFSFSEKIRKHKKFRITFEKDETTPQPGSHVLPASLFSYTATTQIRQFFNQVRIDFFGILKSTPFIVIILAGIINMGSALAFVTDSIYGNKSFPVTYIVIDSIRGTLYLFLVAIIIFYTGVLVWKERDAKVNEIYDALPYSKWIPPVSKLIAMILIIVVIMIAAIITGVIAQAAYGFTEFKLDVYVKELLLLDLLQFAFLVALSFFVHTLVNNRYLGYFIFIAFIILNIFVWRALNVSSNMVIFGGVPTHTYSDMNRFNPYVSGLTWFNIYWLLFCGLLVIITLFFWVRGKELAFRNRLSAARQGFSGNYKMVLICILVVWFAAAGFVFYNTKMVNHFTPSLTAEQRTAEYEKLYKKYEGINQPRIQDVKYEIDLWPQERDLKVMALLLIKNTGSTSIDSIHFSMIDGMDVNIDIPNGSLAHDDKDHRYRIYQLNPAMQPGDSSSIKINSTYTTKGFENEVRFMKIVENGSFFNNYDIIPQIGYQSGNELVDKNRRKKCDLPERNRMPALIRNCTDRCMNTYLSNNSDWVNVETVISTSDDQMAVAPGSLVKEWKQDGRNFFHYKLDHPSMNFYSFISARYAVKRDTWNDVKVEVYYIPEHEYNVNKMVASVKNSLKYFTGHFGPYYQNQARIIEFPRYETFAQAFPGTMPYSESIGFIANLEDTSDIDFVYYIVAHEMGHQWWAHQVIGAEMQGATLLSESMAQYSALMVMEEMYGKEKMHKFLKYEMDRYLRSRGQEQIKEVPLIKTEDQGYIHYRKGSVVMYYLKEMIGEDRVNAALHDMIDSFAYRNPPYPNAYDLVDRLENQTPDSLKYIIRDLFYDITLFNNNTTDATYRKLDGEKYEVTVAVASAKFKADSLGKEKSVPINDWIEIGAFAKADKKDENGRQIYTKREKITSDKNTFTFIVNEKPDKAGIDPNYYLVDRMPDDNVKEVEEK